MPIGRSGARKTSEARPIFRAYTFSFVKKKNIFDLQISSQIDKTIKKLQWIPNTIVSTSVFVTFWCLHIWWCQNWFIYPWIEKKLIACIKTDQVYYRALQISMTEFFEKTSNISYRYVNYSHIEFHLICQTGSRICLCRWIQHSF